MKLITDKSNLSWRHQCTAVCQAQWSYTGNSREIFHSRGQKAHTSAPQGFFFFFFFHFWLKIAKDLPQHIFSMSQGLWEKLWLSKINPWAENLKEPLNASKLVVCLDLLLFKSNFVWTFSFKCDTVYTTDCRGAGVEVTNIITTHFRKMLAAKTSSSL